MKSVSQSKAVLQTTVAETLVAGSPDRVFAGVLRLVDRLWGGMTEVVTSDPPGLLLHTVSSRGGDVDAWVTWELTAAGSQSWTRVRLVVDEADTSVGPEPELDAVLALLLESVQAGTVG